MSRDAARFIKVSKVLKHIEMLDVAIMGVVVVTCAGTAYHKQGRPWVECVEPCQLPVQAYHSFKMFQVGRLEFACWCTSELGVTAPK